ncbi:hypothetical protein C2E23DRAFT_883191 [Lenzites betulinus]|nr:hypothetical protein C2E23DRAFT_883191 [Lenzites betulinus]
MSSAYAITLGQSLLIPLYVRARSVLFGDDNMRHILINVFVCDDGLLPADAQVRCMVLKHDCSASHEHEERSGINAALPQAGAQIYVSTDVFTSPIYMVLARKDASNRRLIQVITICLSIDTDRESPAVRIFVRTQTQEGVKWFTNPLSTVDPSVGATEDMGYSGDDVRDEGAGETVIDDDVNLVTTDVDVFD